MFDCSLVTSQGIVIMVACSVIAALGFYAFVRMMRGRKKKLAQEI